MLLPNVLKYISSRVSGGAIRIARFHKRSSDHNFLATGKVSIIIPTRDKHTLLQKCIDSIISQTTYSNYEVIVVNNSSKEPETLGLLSELKNQGVKVLDFPSPFNFSQILNFAVSQSDSDYICFLNNDTEVLWPDWLTTMVSHAHQQNVATVGALLTFPNRLIQHAGLALGFSGIAQHIWIREDLDYLERETGNECYLVMANTFACLVIRRDVYLQVGGLNEEFAVGLNDVDFCVRASELGYDHVLCQSAKLVHHEYQSRRRMTSAIGALKALKEVLLFLRQHGYPKDKFVEKE